MKTYKKLFDKICAFRNLYEAYLKARRGKHNREEVARFTYNLERELFDLQKELKEQIYKTGKYRKFIIFEPKKREISALPFRDRVVHHAICAEIEPIFEKTFIFDSYACRKNKGTHAGVARLKEFIKKTGKDYYVLKCDISKYFPSIDPEILKKILRKKISDERLLRLIDIIIDSSEKGMPIGNLTSQLFANVYLNELDKYIKYELKIKYYLRYMDDFIIIDISKEFLYDLKNKIKIFLSSIELTSNGRKTNIFPVTLGVDFLGYRIFACPKCSLLNLENSNPQIDKGILEHAREPKHSRFLTSCLLARKSTVKRFICRVKKKIRLYEQGYISYDKLMESFNSWEAYLDHGNTYSLKKDLYKRYFKNVV